MASTKVLGKIVYSLLCCASFFITVNSQSSEESQVLTAGPTPKLIYSPNYPGYVRYLEKKYVIMATPGMRIHIKSREMNLKPYPRRPFEVPSSKCKNDYVMVSQVKFCGRDPLDVVTETNRVELIFKIYNYDSRLVLEYSEVKPIEHRINSTTPYTLQLTASPTSPKVLLLTIDASSPSSFDFKARVTPIDYNNTRLIVDIPPDQIASRNCETLNISAGYNGETHFSDCTAPFHTMYLPQGSFEIAIFSKSKYIFDNYVLKIVFKASPQDTIPASIVTAGPIKSYLWISDESLRKHSDREIQVTISSESRKYTYVDPARSGALLLYGEFITFDPALKDIVLRNSIIFEAASRDVMFTKSSTDSLAYSSDQQSLSLADRVNIYNGPNSDYHDLTYDCNGELQSSNHTISYGEYEATIGFNKSRSTQEGFGFWLSFRSFYNTRLPPALSLTPPWSTPLLKVRSGIHCRWNILNPGASWLQFKATLSGLSGGKVVNVTTGSRTLAYISNDEGSDRWLFTNDTNLNIALLALKSPNLNATAEFHLQTIASADNAIDLKCPVTVLTAEKMAKTASAINYPNYYPRNMECRWRFETMDNKLASIVLEFDNVPCYEGAKLETIARGRNDWRSKKDLCANWYWKYIPKFFEIPVRSDLVFRSGLGRVYPGFKFNYYKNDSSKICAEMLDLTLRGYGYLSGKFFHNSSYGDFDSWKVSSLQEFQPCRPPGAHLPDSTTREACRNVRECEYVVYASDSSKLIFEIKELNLLPTPKNKSILCENQETRFEFEEKDTWRNQHHTRCSGNSVKVVMSSVKQVTLRLIRAVNTYVQFRIYVKNSERPESGGDTSNSHSEDSHSGKTDGKNRLYVIGIFVPIAIFVCVCVTLKARQRMKIERIRRTTVTEFTPPNNSVDRTSVQPPPPPPYSGVRAVPSQSDLPAQAETNGLTEAVRPVEPPPSYDQLPSVKLPSYDQAVAGFMNRGFDDHGVAERNAQTCDNNEIPAEVYSTTCM